MKRILLLVLAILLAGGFIYLAVTEAIDVKKKQKLDTIQIESKELEVNKLELDLKQLNTELKTQLKKKDLDQKEIERLQNEIKDRQEREKALERELQAKLDRKAKEQQKLATAAKNATRTQTASAASGTCADWMAAAGIADTEATRKLILKESGCNPRAVNPSSGACGIPQAYPCSKLPNGVNTDPVTQLKWMQNYVNQRYGSWDNALSTWYSRCGTKQGCWY